MPSARLTLLTAITMIAFAGNSLLCRLALTGTSIDAASFTTIRVASGAITLAVLVVLRRGDVRPGGNWISAMSLLAYAAAFSFAYVSLPTATGALLLFGAVQATMIGYGWFVGERPNAMQVGGILLASAGLIALFLPGLHTPPLAGAVLMIGAGCSWGVYSLRGRGRGGATRETAGNFLRAVPMALAISLVMWRSTTLDVRGVVLATLSGALTSGVGYAIWYTVLPSLRATTAATVQLSVPALAALGAVALLGEPISLRLALSAGAVLGGVGLYILSKGGVVVTPSRPER
ncbi:MAG: DMT family transporter [Gemmatimonadota bacterium]